MKRQVLYDPYYSDGYLLEAASALADAAGTRPEGRRLHAGVLVVMFTALSAEAHINYAIFSAFAADQERDRLLRLELRAKLQYIPQLVTGRRVFDPARAPLGDLFALVDARNKMVHAKPAKWEISKKGDGWTISWESTGIALDVAARYLSSLCRYLNELENAEPKVWKDQAWLARELLALDKALRRWKPSKHRAPLSTLVAHLTDYLPDV